MSDALGSGSAAAEPLPLIPRMLVSLGGFFSRLPYALFLSAIFSILLVLFVGLLIAFMQYQSRLLRVQPTLSASDVVHLVATNRRLEQRFVELDKLGREVAELSPEYHSTHAEIEFRTKRICSLFHDNELRRQTCRDYLRSIPFGETQAARVVNTVADAEGPYPFGALSRAWAWWRAKPEPVDVRMPPEVSRSIRKRFVEIMSHPGQDDANKTLAETVELYTWDIEQTAAKNVRYWLRLRSPYCDKNSQYQSTCNEIIRLAQDLKKYRDVDANVCHGVLSQPQDYSLPGCALPQPDPNAYPLKPEVAAMQRPGSAASATTGQSAARTDGAAPDSNKAPPAGGEGQYSGTLDAPGDTPASNRQTTYELVSNYQFYDGVFFGIAKDLLLSPSDFLALTLACTAGMLGALLRMVFFTYVSGRDPNFRTLFIGPILGLICALVVYILFRAGFIVITDRSQGSDSATLSPFVIAIMSLSAGLLSERAIDLFRRTSGTWLGSAEATQSSRWAVRLNEALEARGVDLEKLADRLEVSSTKIADWAAEKDMVPIDKQREISLVLDMPIRALFTDLPPPSGRTA